MSKSNNKDKVVLITGGSGGIGKHTVLKFAREGYTTYAATRSIESDTMKELKSIAKAESVKIRPIYIDLTKKPTIKQAINTVIKNEGKIDILINNAAAGYFSAVEDIEEDAFVTQIKINVIGMIQTIQSVLPYMRDRKAGTIINVSSILGFSTVPLNSPYSSSKYALESISETLALEVKPFGINVIIVQPGDFHSEFLKKATYATYTSKSPYYKLYKRHEIKPGGGYGTREKSRYIR